ncbi:MAG: acyl carrier protein [Solirubrobacterales bacterium]
MPETQSKEQIAARVTEALVEFGEQRDKITPEARFSDLDVDSLDLVELAQIVEDTYGVEITDADMEKLETVGDVVDLIAARSA